MLCHIISLLYERQQAAHDVLEARTLVTLRLGGHQRLDIEGQASTAASGAETRVSVVRARDVTHYCGEPLLRQTLCFL